jgi:hypothetical protein
MNDDTVSAEDRVSCRKSRQGTETEVSFPEWSFFTLHDTHRPVLILLLAPDLTFDFFDASICSRAERCPTAGLESVSALARVDLTAAVPAGGSTTDKPAASSLSHEHGLNRRSGGP